MGLGLGKRGDNILHHFELSWIRVYLSRLGPLDRTRYIRGISPQHSIDIIELYRSSVGWNPRGLSLTRMAGAYLYMFIWVDRSIRSHAHAARLQNVTFWRKSYLPGTGYGYVKFRNDTVQYNKVDGERKRFPNNSAKRRWYALSRAKRYAAYIQRLANK